MNTTTSPSSQEQIQLISQSPKSELKVCETNTANSSIDEPMRLTKGLPPHLVYAFLEGDNKLPSLLPKELDVEEKIPLSSLPHHEQKHSATDIPPLSISLQKKDCPDCEDSQFCHSSRVSHPQLHLGIRYPNLID
ncbi:hypothetical protein Tco_1393684 [Tanacetum coccineum]